MGFKQTATVKIKNPCKGLLMESIRNVAKKIGGRVDDYIVDYYGNRIKATSLKTKNLPRGIAIYIKDGKIEVDENLYFSFREKINKIKRNLKTEYISLAVQEALREMGYTIQVKETNREILITAGEGS